MDKFVPNKNDIKKRMEFNRLFVKTPCEKCGELQWFDDLCLIGNNPDDYMMVCKRKCISAQQQTEG